MFTHTVYDRDWNVLGLSNCWDSAILLAAAFTARGVDCFIRKN